MAKQATVSCFRGPGVALLTALAIVAAAFTSSCDPSPREQTSRLPPEVSTPEIKQARWKIKSHRAGAVGKVRRADKKRLRAQRPRLAGLIRDVYDSLFLYPSRKKPVLRKHFSKNAARRLGSSRVGVPANAELVRTRSRRAVIGIQPHSARRAAAVVTVRAKGRVRDRVFRIVHRATLWLERPKRVWKVIGFEVKQGPIKSRDANRKALRGKRGDKRRSERSGQENRTRNRRSKRRDRRSGGRNR